MASPSQRPAGLDRFLQADEGSNEYTEYLCIIAAQLEHAQLNVTQLVESLSDVLTSTTDATRSRGALLLAEVISRVPASLDSPQTVHHLATFFASRISDWPSLKPALKGCLALLQQRAAPAPNCVATDAEAMTRALLDVNIQSLTVVERQLCLRLFTSLITGYSSDLVRSPLGLLEGAAAALDGERDPRCLLAGFSLIHQLGKAYRSSGNAPAKELEKHAQELVDVLGCYFPIVYTPPADTTGKVTREELVSGVERALSAAPAFAQYVVPMLLEKLSSSFRQSQEDALSALAACTKGYGSATMAQHLPKIWDALRTILTAPSDSDLALEDRIKAEELAGKAQTCLKECARALGAEGDMQLVDLVLDDGIVRDLLDDVADAGQRGGFAGASARAQAAAPVLAAVTGSSPLGSARVCQRLLGSLIRLTSAAQNSESQQLGLRAVLCLVSATREAVVDALPSQPGAGESARASDAGLHQNGHAGVSASNQPETSTPSQQGSKEGNQWDRGPLLVGKGADVLQLALGNAAAQHLAVDSQGDLSAEGSTEGGPSSSSKEPGPHALGADHRETLMLQLQILAQLATFSIQCSPLSESQQQKALIKLLEIACTGPMPGTTSPERPGLVIPPQRKQPALSTSGGQGAFSDVMCSALESMAGQGYGNLLSSVALPRLFAAAGLPSPNLAHPGTPDVHQPGVPPSAEEGEETRMHSSSGTNGGPVSLPVASGRSFSDHTALRALASIAKASSPLRGPILAAFTAGIPAALLAAATGGRSSHSVLLETLSDERLLANDKKGAEAVVLELLNVITDLSKAHRTISGAALVDAATVAQVATSICSGVGDAFYIAHKACDIITSGACSLPARPHAEVAQEVIPAAAAIAARPSAFAPDEVILQVLRALLDLALGVHDEFAASVAAFAAASIVNKAAGGEEDRAVAAALDDILLPRLAQGDATCKRALSSLGQLSRALVMRGHPRFQDILEAALKLADDLADSKPIPMDASPGPESATLDQPTSAATGPATVADAAQVFATLVEFDESPGLDAPSRIFHKGRVLWQQRAFSVAADLLLQRYEAALQKGDTAPSKGVIASLERLLTAAKRDTPAAVTAGYERVLPAVLTSLAALDGSADGRDDVIAGALLEQVQQALETPQGQAVLEGELDRLVPHCARQSAAAASASHRAMAVATLDAVAAYPYHLLHPFRAQVLSALSKAVDDRKRGVRAAAVRCRRKWGTQQM